MDQVRQELCYHHYALNTERTYCERMLRFMKFKRFSNAMKQIC